MIEVGYITYLMLLFLSSPLSRVLLTRHQPGFNVSLVIEIVLCRWDDTVIDDDVTFHRNMLIFAGTYSLIVFHGEHDNDYPPAAAFYNSVAKYPRRLQYVF